MYVLEHLPERSLSTNFLEVYVSSLPPYYQIIIRGIPGVRICAIVVFALIELALS